MIVQGLTELLAMARLSPGDVGAQLAHMRLDALSWVIKTLSVHLGSRAEQAEKSGVQSQQEQALSLRFAVRSLRDAVESLERAWKKDSRYLWGDEEDAL